jgi:hypothetical protein
MAPTCPVCVDSELANDGRFFECPICGYRVPVNGIISVNENDTNEDTEYDDEEDYTAVEDDDDNDDDDDIWADDDDEDEDDED